MAVTCQPAVGEATQVSWVRFADADAMTGWIDAEGRSVLTWTRAGSLIGSVAVSDGSIGDVTMADLAAWWEAGGHLP